MEENTLLTSRHTLNAYYRVQLWLPREGIRQSCSATVLGDCLSKAAKPAWAEQMTQLHCLVENVKFPFYACFYGAKLALRKYFGVKLSRQAYT